MRLKRNAEFRFCAGKEGADLARIIREQIFEKAVGQGTFKLCLQTEIVDVYLSDEVKGKVRVSLIALCENTGSLTFGTGTGYIFIGITRALFSGGFTLDEGERVLAQMVVYNNPAENPIEVEVAFNQRCEEAGINEDIILFESVATGKLASSITASADGGQYVLGDYMSLTDFELEEGYDAKADVYLNGKLAATADVDIENRQIYLNPEWAAVDKQYYTGDMMLLVYPYCGSKRVNVSAQIDASYTVNISDCMPCAVLNVTAVSENEAVQAFGELVRNKSAAMLSIADCYARLGADITEKYMVLDGVTYSDDVITTDILTEACRHTWSVTVTDSRGLSATESGSFEVLDYAPPTFTGDVYRGNAQGERDATGTYACMRLKADDVFSYGGINETSIYYAVRKRAAFEEFSEEVIFSKSNSLIKIDFAFEMGESYDLKIICRDSFGGESERIFLLDSARIELNISKNAVAVGKYTSEENLFESAWDAKINGDITYTDIDGLPLSLRENGIRLIFGAAMTREEVDALLNPSTSGAHLAVIEVLQGLFSLKAGTHIYFLYKDGDSVLKVHLGETEA